MARQRSAVSPGDRIGRYRIVARLGAGGMGEVYRAHDTVLGRMVALKCLRPSDDERTADEESQAILREARAAAAIEHPNAVAIFDVDEADGVPFLAMELIEGKTLRQLLGPGGPPLDVRIAWLRDVARALAAAHARHLVHRDVKPDNVMIRDDGVVKVLDFGIARPMRAPIDAEAVTRTMQRVGGGGAVWNGTAISHGIRGTPAYMAPEQLRGEPLDGRADQFAWGMLAYELLTGTPPWPTGDLVTMVAHSLTDPPPPPRARNEAIPPHVEEVILRALAKAPRDRFASMDEVLAALRAPDEAPAEPNAEHRAGPWIFAGAAALMLATAWIPPRSRAPHPPPAAPPVAPEREVSALSPNSAATEAYRTALQNVRDACQNEALAGFDEATSLDPTFAAAHLRAAAYARLPDTAMRTHLQRAWQHRAQLGAKDVALVEAFQPAANVPVDWRETETRLEALGRRYPRDAEIALFIGVARCNVNDSAGGIAAFDDAVARDPRFALALLLKATAQFAAESSTSARTAYQECLRISPASTSCLLGLTIFAKTAGQCEEVEAIGRRLIALRPSDPDGYVLLAEAAYGLTGNLEESRALFERTRHLTTPRRKADVLADAVRLDVLSGHFTEAEAEAREWESTIASSPGEWEHIGPRWYRMLIALEVGHSAEASRLAQEYLRARTAWVPVDSARQSETLAYYVLRRSGGVRDDAMAIKRKEWADREFAYSRATGSKPSIIFWLSAYASLAVTPADAAEALAVLPSYSTLGSVEYRSVSFEFALGEIYRLSNNAEAIAHLSAAANWCEPIRHPFIRPQAHYALGLALEAAHDKSAACRAFRIVESIWGQAVPRSRTAELARERADALGCAGERRD